MNRKVNILILLIIAILIALPAYVCGWMMSDRQQDINQSTTITIGQVEKIVKTNINTATNAELDDLTGISDSKVNSIVKNRPYSDVYQLLEKGILGETVFNKIKDKLTI